MRGEAIAGGEEPMSDIHGSKIAVSDRVHKFVVACATDELTDGLRTEFEQLLRESDDACRLYLECVDVSVVLPSILSAIPDEESPSDIGFLEQPQAAFPPAPLALDGVWHGAVGYFASGWPVAYLIATVIFGLGLLIGSHVYVSQPAQVARLLSVPSRVDAEPKNEPVGRITGMVDCQFEEGSGFRVQGSESVVSGQWPAASGQKQPESRFSSHQPLVTSRLVSLGDKFTLASGLMEITYDTGGKVILQGPVTYEVESASGGYLAVGKLTGKVEKKAEESDAQSLIPNPSLSTTHSPLFTIKTPTATVTDLGTEFGVEVSKEGITETHVFLGKVRLQGAAQGGNSLERILSAGQAARLDQRAVAVEIAANSGDRFLRQMPAVKTAAAPELIDRIDYSDTWTANSPTRPGSNLPLTDPVSLQVEQCHGNPPRTWEVPSPTMMTTWPNDPRWPGFQVQGSRSGVMEVGGDCHCGFEYNLRDDFVVQFDAVQTADLINVTIGQSVHYTSSLPTLSVFVRAAGVPTADAVFPGSRCANAHTRRAGA